MFKNWQSDATASRDVVENWWSRNPEANVGVACGKGSNLTVIDIDGEEGRGRFHELERELGELPECPIVITGSGGEHRYCQYEPGLNNAVRFDVGLDIRTEGGLVIGAGSANANGPYLFGVSATLEDIQPPKMPKGWVDYIKSRQGGNGNGAGFKMPEQPVVEGEGRNNLLYLAGRSLKGKGFTAAAIRGALEATNRDRCLPPVNNDELEAIVKQVLTQADRPGFKEDLHRRAPYLATKRGLFFQKVDGSGAEISVPLANFWARIVRHLKRDDGLEATHDYEIEAHRADETITVSAPATKFASLGWVAERLPPRFILCAGATTRDRFREATQKLSDYNIPDSIIYTAPGWRTFGDRAGYVHGGGVIGADVDVRVEFPDDLAPFVLRAAPTGEELKKGGERRI